MKTGGGSFSAACGFESARLPQRCDRESTLQSRGPAANDSWLTPRTTMVQVHPGLLRRPGTPTGRAARLKPARLQVRLLLWALLAMIRLGRQLADHLGLEPGMLWVRVPPELLQITFVLVEQPGVLASLSRRRSRVQIPSGTLDSTVRKLEKRRSSNLRDSAGSTPTRATR